METSKSLNDIFKRKKAVYSFEIFPPKKTDGIALVYRAIDQIKTLEPDFISVTYGAGAVSYTHLFQIPHIWKRTSIKSEDSLSPTAMKTTLGLRLMYSATLRNQYMGRKSP